LFSFDQLDPEISGLTDPFHPPKIKQKYPMLRVPVATNPTKSYILDIYYEAKSPLTN